MTLAEFNKEAETALAQVGAEEKKFLARLSGAERLLAAANDDLERWELREDFARAQVIAQAAGWERAASLASRLKQRAGRFIAKANPPKARGGDRRSGDFQSLHGATIETEGPAVNPGTLRSLRSVHNKVSDEVFDRLDAEAEAKSEVLTEKVIREYVKKQEAEEKHERRKAAGRAAVEAAALRESEYRETAAEILESGDDVGVTVGGSARGSYGAWADFLARGGKKGGVDLLAAAPYAGKGWWYQLWQGAADLLTPRGVMAVAVEERYLPAAKDAIQFGPKDARQMPSFPQSVLELAWEGLCPEGIEPCLIEDEDETGGRIFLLLFQRQGAVDPALSLAADLSPGDFARALAPAGGLVVDALGGCGYWPALHDDALAAGCRLVRFYTQRDIDFDRVKAPVEPLVAPAVNSYTVGDVVDYLSSFPAGVVSGIVSSPPFNRGLQGRSAKGSNWAAAGLYNGYENCEDNMPWDDYIQWQWTILQQCMRIVGSAGCVLWEYKPRPSKHDGYRDLRPAMVELESHRLLRDIITWERAGDQNQDRHFLPPNSSNIYLLAGPEWRVPDAVYSESRSWGRVWDFPQESRPVDSKGFKHPAPFPLPLATRMVKLCGGPVMDPFAGTGTVGIAAANLGVDYYLNDNGPRSKAYFEEWRDRLGQQARLGMAAD